MKIKIPDFGVTPPKGYRWLVESGVMGFKEWGPVCPWHLIDNDEPYSPTELWPDVPASGKLIAFARRQDGDDFACFEIKDDQVVAIVHTHVFTNEGFDACARYPSIWVWLKDVLDDVAELDGLKP